MIHHGDSLEVLKSYADESVDLLCTDPPYGYSFMGKSWDKALPDIGIFKECFRVLKPGAFAFVMSAPRSDVCSRMAILLEDAGFKINFTPIYWTYASGFPKAMNIGKMVDKRRGVKGEEYIDQDFLRRNPKDNSDGVYESGLKDGKEGARRNKVISSLDGSYGGFQPKPAVEVVIVAMKPLSEKTYVDQALKNGKGITWLDDCRVPTLESLSRFPANLLVSDDVLNDGRVIKDTGHFPRTIKTNSAFESGHREQEEKHMTGGGSYSRYFDLGAWAQTLPFLIVPKAAKREKNEGLDCIVSITIIDEWDKEAKPVQLQVAMDNSHLRATVVSGTQNKDVIAWSMSLFGKEYMDVPFLLNTKSTTLTETSSITPQIISSYLTGLLTSGRIANAYLKTESGGNPVQPAENSNTSESITNEETESATSASLVSSKERYAISVKDGSNIHSTVKPLKLMSYLITLGSRPGDVVLDPFLGSGTTAIAAKQLGRECIGIEREKEYVEIAEARLKAMPDALL